MKRLDELNRHIDEWVGDLNGWVGEFKDNWVAGCLGGWISYMDAHMSGWMS